MDGNGGFPQFPNDSFDVPGAEDAWDPMGSVPFTLGCQDCAILQQNLDKYKYEYNILEIAIAKRIQDQGVMDKKNGEYIANMKTQTKSTNKEKKKCEELLAQKDAHLTSKEGYVNTLENTVKSKQSMIGKLNRDNTKLREIITDLGVQKEKQEKEIERASVDANAKLQAELESSTVSCPRCRMTSMMVQQLKTRNHNLYTENEKVVEKLKTQCSDLIRQNEAQKKKEDANVDKYALIKKSSEILERQFLINIMLTMTPKRIIEDMEKLYIVSSKAMVYVIKREVYELESIRLFNEDVYMFRTNRSYIGTNLYIEKDMIAIMNKLMFFCKNHSNLWVSGKDVLALETGVEHMLSMKRIRDMTERHYQVIIPDSVGIKDHTLPPMEPKGLYLCERVRNRSHEGTIRLFYRT